MCFVNQAFLEEGVASRLTNYRLINFSTNQPEFRFEVILANKHLERIPFEVQSYASTLKIVDISFNNIAKLDDSLLKLTALQTLRITGNSLESLPVFLAKTKGVDIYHEWPLYCYSKKIERSNLQENYSLEKIDFQAFKKSAQSSKKNGSDFVEFDGYFEAVTGKKLEPLPDTLYRHASFACTRSHKGFFKWLISFCPSLVNFSHATTGETLIELSISMKKKEIIQLLASNSQVINMGNNSVKGTPAHQMMLNHTITPNLMKMMMLAGFHSNSKDHDGHTILHLAFKDFDRKPEMMAKICDQLLFFGY